MNSLVKKVILKCIVPLNYKCIYLFSLLLIIPFIEPQIFFDVKVLGRPYDLSQIPMY